ncbi:hypothetical protein [Brevibacillus nitrificans]|uniref:hypothetical protein n=1 Tax=Brevibacillus nitrificans TaxID=651560 RepID=UPI002856D4B2|nr:hypothetical protein [Brevibacillus nitrificans]MDR7314943.1 hypothetical protein [Brevibacillus nitrificans]
MDVEVYYSGQRGGTMPYTALPAFRLFCKQNGFQLKWDPKNKRVDLDSGLKGKVCVLYTGPASTENAYEKEIVEKVQRFVSEYRMEVVFGPKNSAAAANADVALRVSVKEMRLLEKPRILLFQQEDRRELVKSLQSELKQTGMPCLIRTNKAAKSGNAAVHLQLQIPRFTEIYKRKAYAEKLAFYLASGILNYFQEDLHIQPFAYLPPNLLRVFFDSVMFGQSLQGKDESEQVNASEGVEDLQESDERDAPEASHEESDDDDKLDGDETKDLEELQELGEEELVLTIHEPEEEPVLEEVTEETQNSEAEENLTEAKNQAEAEESPAEEEQDFPVNQDSIEESNMGEPSLVLAEPAVHHPIPASMQTAQTLEAEVYFDYTLIHSDSEDRPFLLIGTLQVKNTGTADLYNPIVCLRVTPADSIKMGGQILPPKFVETMAVQGASGLSGWRYLNDDWFAQAQERGEYWIAPIQPVLIEPKATEAFQNFQISFLKQPSGKGVTVEGVVLCNNQEVNFSANNRIAISF